MANEDQKTEEPENRSSVEMASTPTPEPLQQMVVQTSPESFSLNKEEEEVDVEKLLAEAEEEQFAHLENKQVTPQE